MTSRTSEPNGDRPSSTVGQRFSTPRIGMQDVADRAGVALSSVSRVLSGHPDVSDVMRNRVLDAVAALGYERDLLAQGLRRGVSMTIGFVVGNISNPLFAEIALGAERELRNAGYTMLLADSFADPALDQSNIRLLVQRRVDGLLLSVTDELATESAAVLDRANTPAVLVDRDTSKLPVASAVLSDHASGIESATTTLINLGHRRIALVNGPADVRPARERAAALRRACHRHPGVTAVVRNGTFTREHGESATTALFNERDLPTAIIAGSNQILVGVLRVLRAKGLSVPRDLSLVTCDDVPLSEFLEPPLATISRDPEEMGRVAAVLLLEQIRGQKPRSVTLPTGFRITESCAAPGEASVVSTRAATTAGRKQSSPKERPA
jgi:LacI family transcriptional regulator